jgi:Skp family chaperone for outer membrane proteins
MDPKDHDLLIELKTEMKGLRQDVRSLSDNTTAQIRDLQRDKLDWHDFKEYEVEAKTSKKDHEERIRTLEKAFWRGIGALAVIQMVAQFLISKFLQ